MYRPVLFLGTFVALLWCSVLWSHDLLQILSIGGGIFLAIGGTAFGFAVAKNNLPNRIHDRWKDLIASGVGVLLACGVITYHAAKPPATIYQTLSARPTFTIIGRIAEGPVIGDKDIQYVLRDITVVSGSIIQAPLGGVIVKDRSMWPRAFIGDIVEIHGEGRQLRPAMDSWQVQDIHATLTVEAMQIRSQGPFSFLRWMTSLRLWVEERTAQLFPEPAAALLAGLIVGSRSALPLNLLEDFRNTGTLHITAVSGANIALVVTLASGCLFFIPLRLRFPPLLLCIVLYTIVVGGSASVIRAAIMGSCTLIAMHTGRLPNARIALLLAAAVMLGLQPRLIVDDAGFQLSFLSVIGIQEYFAILERRLWFLPRALELRSAVAITLAASLTTLPWSAYLFSSIPLLSPFVNAAIAPLIPLGSIIGGVAVVGSMANMVLGRVIAFAAQGFLQGIIATVHWFGSLSFVVLKERIAPPALLCYYLGLLLLTVALHLRQRSVQTNALSLNQATPALTREPCPRSSPPNRDRA